MSTLNKHGGSRVSAHDGRKLPPEELAALKQRIQRLVDEGLPKLVIARRLGVSPTTVNARLRDKTR
jgi:DNA-binding NarL/FixJ family response regulator